MELRQYWRVLVRRRNVIRNTFLLVAVLGLLTVAYSYLGASYQGHAQFNVAVQPEGRSRTQIYDVNAAAQQNTTYAVQELTKYAATTQYFKDVSKAIGGKSNDWKAIQQASKVYLLPDSHDIYVEYDGSNQNKIGRIVTEETALLQAHIGVVGQTFGFPPIKSIVTDLPTTQRVSYSKPLVDFLLRAALGLVAGIILAYLFEYLDDTVQDEADVRQWMNLPTLAVIPGGSPVRRPRSA